MQLGQKPEPYMKCKVRLKLFLAAHWRGTLCVLVPLIAMLIVIPFPGLPWQWCAFTLMVMAFFWVTECIPLAVTGFMPVIVFPLTGVMSTSQTCRCYINDTVFMFLGSLILAYSVEQCGLHRRLAYGAIRCFGYSHFRLLFAMSLVTMFVSFWITNTAATTMMVPINFAILNVFEEQQILKLYEINQSGDQIASDMTTCYFCATTYAATVGGIGTLVGTATNLVFKGLFISAYPAAPEYLSFPLYSAFAVPYVLVLQLLVYLCMAYLYLGLFRSGSDVAKAAFISETAKAAAKQKIDQDSKNLGHMTFWEWMVIILFGTAMISFFCRSPQMFPGWGDRISEYFGYQNSKFVLDSALAYLIAFLMFLLPSTLAVFHNFKAKYQSDLPKGRVSSVLDWKRMNAELPFSFIFLLGGGFALSEAAKVTGLNEKIGMALQSLKSLPNSVVLLIVIMITCFVTNFASNVAVCNVFAPIAMQVAKQTGQNPLWYNLAAGISASYCFILPVGTPGNLVVQSAAKIPTAKMMKAGLGPTIVAILLTWLAIYYWAPVIWPDLKKLPYWIGAGAGVVPTTDTATTLEPPPSTEAPPPEE